MTDGQKQSHTVIAASVTLGCIFLFAAASKLFHIYAFEGAVDLILARVFPSTDLPFALLRKTITVGVISVEAMLGTALVVFANRCRVPASIAVVMLLVFSGVLIRLAFMKDPPPCGCLGGIELAVQDSRAATRAGLIRNAGLLLMAGWLFKTSPGRSPRRRSSSTPTPNTAHHAPNGFTLIEVLVSIVIIAVLIAILLPALAGARRQAKDTSILSSIRQAGVAVTDYTNEEHGYFPYRGETHKPKDYYFRSQAKFWPTVLVAHGVDLSGKLPRTKWTESKVVETFFWLTHAAHARPEYWGDDDSVIENDLMYEGTRLDEGLFPSRKGMLIDVAFNEDSTGARVTFLDGSASFIPFSKTPLHIDADIRRPFSATPWRVLTTPDGIRGVDSWVLQTTSTPVREQRQRHKAVARVEHASSASRTMNQLDPPLASDTPAEHLPRPTSPDWTRSQPMRDRCVASATSRPRRRDRLGGRRIMDNSIRVRGRPSVRHGRSGARQPGEEHDRHPLMG